MADERTEFGFKRIVCDCSACSKFCFAMPGYLVPSDIRRMAERLNEPDIAQFAFDNLLASPGAIVIANGAYRTIPTLVPARKPDGSCRFLKNGRCEIHADAPFGCAYVSTEQSREESDAISARGLQEIAKAWRNGDLYACVADALSLRPHRHFAYRSPREDAGRGRIRWGGSLTMKPLQHARITAHRYGGEWQDWITVHDWIDRSKVIFPSMQHRMFIHSDFGEWLAVKIHGEAIVANDGTVISTRDLFHDHQVEDLGRVVTLAEWLREIDADYWTRRRRSPRQLEQVREEPAEGLVARWGGVPGDYLALIDFFDKPCEFAPDSPDAAAMITHNSFGIFLAEELLGTVITLTETNDSRQVPQIISTRSAAEDLVYARIGSIPPAGNLAAHTRLRLWMCGTEVGAALKTRRTNERAAIERE